MLYREMIKKVQHYSGLSDSESENALITFVKLLSGRLTPDERMDFASQLPAELQDTVVSIDVDDDDMSMEDMLETMAEKQHVDEDTAKTQVIAAWRTLSDAISPDGIDEIRSQLPTELTTQLY